jgi:predicted DNA-binding transcriptional regulator AlpA
VEGRDAVVVNAENFCMKQYPGGLRSCNTALIARGKDRDTMDNDVNESWLSRQELADRYGLPAKTLAQWASKGTGPPYARMGRYVGYRLSDLIEWETERINDLREAAQSVAPTDRASELFTRPASHDGRSDSIGNVR